MKRIPVTGASNIGKAGVATILYSWGQNFDEDKIVYDYLSQRGLPDEEFQVQIAGKGGLIHVPGNASCGGPGRITGLIRWVGQVLREEGYDTLHINADSAYLAAVYMAIARRAGVKHMVVHSHSTMIDDLNPIRRWLKILLHYLCRPYVRSNSTVKLACSGAAGEWMFKKDQTVVIPNGIDLEKFRYDEESRAQYRREFHLEGKFVIGCVGRLAYQKNYPFTLQIFEEILKTCGDAYLMIVGDGEERELLEKSIARKGLKDKVLLLGNRHDVNQLLSCMDVFLLPSRFEGLGMVYIEAQAAGMPVFASDVVPEEAFATHLIRRLGLSDSPKQWARAILAVQNTPREDVTEELSAAGYSIRGAAEKLQRVYLEMETEK